MSWSEPFGVAMLLFAAASSTAQAPGPLTFTGPGNYCGGGFVVRLERGDRVVFMPPQIDVAMTSLEIAGRRVQVGSGPGGPDGRVVARIPGWTIYEERDDGHLIYYIDDGSPFTLALSSDAFRGYRRDRWFFDRANFRPGAERQVSCLEGQSAP